MTALCKWERELKSGKFGGGSPPCAMGGAWRGLGGALRAGAVVFGSCSLESINRKELLHFRTENALWSLPGTQTQVVGSGHKAKPTGSAWECSGAPTTVPPAEARRDLFSVLSSPQEAPMAPCHLQASFAGSRLFLIYPLGVLCLPTNLSSTLVQSRPRAPSHFSVSACEVFCDRLGHTQTHKFQPFPVLEILRAFVRSQRSPSG